MTNARAKSRRNHLRSAKKQKIIVTAERQEKTNPSLNLSVELAEPIYVTHV